MAPGARTAVAPIQIRTNISSSIVERRLSIASKELFQSYEKLSSGRRINSAADDAAGLAIADALRTDRSVYLQGVRNVNDGISLLSVADSAISELSGIATRLQELAEQSANGTYGSAQRSALDSEAQALSREYSRIIQTTSFNGVNLLDGSFSGGTRIQGGYGVNGGILSGVGGAIGTGQFDLKGSSSAADGAYSVSSADFNGDGELDIAVAGGAGNNVVVQFGDGTGSFQTSQTLQAGTFPANILLADVDADSYVDIISTDTVDSSFSVFLGNADGSFSARVSYVAGVQPKRAIAADFNGDGSMDLAFAVGGYGKLFVSFGNGDGTFQAARSYSGGSGTNGISAGDLNGDDILDIVTSEQASGTLRVYIGNSDGSFKAAVSYAAGSQPSAVQIADVNNDSILDLISSNTGDSDVSIFLGTGTGTFGSRTTYAVSGGPFDLTVIDFNGDGFVDIATANSTGNTLTVLLNSGTGTYNSRTSYATQTGPYGINANDFNGDGVADLVASNLTSDSITVYLGRTTAGTAPLLPFDLKTSAGARQALPVFENTIDLLATQRGTIGALLSRFSVSANNLSIAQENFGTAESNIRDVDIADEASKLTRTKIIQDAATSILAQANAQPKLALQLLTSASGGGK